MAEAGTLHDAFVDELRDTYDAEKQLIKALPKLAKASSSAELKAAFEEHLEQTLKHVERLEQVFEEMGETARGKHCDGIAGIIAEGKTIMDEDFDEMTMDACLIAAGQRAEHYEMAAYGTLVAWAQRSVRMLVPAGFLTPFQAIVSRRQDFVCRTEFSSHVSYEQKGDLHYFTYAGDNSVRPDAVMHLRSEQATVVIDTMQERRFSASC